MQETPLLSSIHTLKDYKRIPGEDLGELAREIRLYLVDLVSKNGGHLASNLGAVELTMALHRVFNCPSDKLVFDVGHQCYVHKLLTGRAGELGNLRKEEGAAGFPKREESLCDAFNTGHSSTSVSAALGMLRAMRLRGDKTHHAVALIGDGALTGGMAYEAMNDAGQSSLPLIILLNDNGMSIARNVGAITRHLSDIRASKRYNDIKRGAVRLVGRIPRVGQRIYGRISRLKARIKYFLLPNVWFEELGFTYLGPIDGHDIGALIRVLENAKALGEPVVIHAVTQKGKGYGFAESYPDKFHGIGAFDPRTGYAKSGSACTNSDVLGMVLCDLAQKDPKIAAVTAAMTEGTGLREFSLLYPERFFDVAIAEQHAVTMAAGLAACGMKPVVAVYSSFLQRAYDQILHDVALQNLPVVFAVDRAGLVGEDGETHQGVYDLAYLQTIPGLDIYAPATMAELAEFLKLAIASGRPAAVRYPRGALMDMPMGVPAERGKWAVLNALRPITVVAAGRMVQTAMEAAEGLDTGLVSARCIRPVDETVLAALRTECRCVVCAEDGIRDGGLGSRLCEALCGSGVEVVRVGVGEKPVSHASVARQHELCGMDAPSIRDILLEKGARVL